MIKGYTISKHVLHDRMKRVNTIAESIGFGTPIYFSTDTTTAENKAVIITDSGVIFITNPVSKVIVTLYVGQFEQIYGITRGNLNQTAYKKIKNNINIYHKKYGIV